MKVVFKIAASWAAIWLVGYVAGSFTAANFNIADWTYASRSFIAMYAVMASVVSAVAIIVYQEA